MTDQKYTLQIEQLYTIPEAAKIFKTNQNFVYSLINKGLLKALKLGRLKVRGEEIYSFLRRYEGMDLSDLNDIKPLELEGGEESVAEITI